MAVRWYISPSLKIIFQNKKTEKKESHSIKADKRKNQKETE